MALVWSDLAYLSLKAMIWITAFPDVSPASIQSTLFFGALSELESAVQSVADSLQEMDSERWRDLTRMVESRVGMVVGQGSEGG
jgi:hypothetical protein